jgi:hypothetical protein
MMQQPNRSDFERARLEVIRNKVALAWRCRVNYMTGVGFDAYATRDGATADAILVFTSASKSQFFVESIVPVPEAGWIDGRNYARHLGIPFIIVATVGGDIYFKTEVPDLRVVGTVPSGQSVRARRTGFRPL